MDLPSNALLQVVNKILQQKMYNLILCFYIDRGPKDKHFSLTLKKSTLCIVGKKEKYFLPNKEYYSNKVWFLVKNFFRPKCSIALDFFGFDLFFTSLVIIREYIRPSRSMLQCFE